MSHLFDIGIFGGDQRQVYMAESLLRKGFRVATYSLSSTITHEKHHSSQSMSELFELSKVLIGPIPMSRDQVTIFSNKEPKDLTIAHAVELLNEKQVFIAGNIPQTIIELCKAKEISYLDLMKNEKITILNAIATAEGTIMEAIVNSDQNIHGNNCLILGYGRCAKVLAQKLKGMDAKVTVAARSEEALAFASSFGHQVIPLLQLKSQLPTFSFIFNTIPALVLDKELLDVVDQDALIIDIASAPGGVDFPYAKQRNIKAKLSLGLPGKVAPKTSADFLVTEILEYVKERSD